MHICLRVCFSVAKAIPLLFILVIIGWSYYAYTIALGIYVIPAANIGEKVLLLFLYHIFLGIFLWAYAQSTCTYPISPPKQFSLSPSDWARLQDTSLSRQERTGFLHRLVRERQLPVFTRAHGDSVRVCEQCRIVKPDRAHHCSTCGQCLLKMDHHCPWVNNCVGFHNYKYFVQFLLYGALFCTYVGCSTAKYFVNFWQDGVSSLQAHRFHVLFLFFAAWMFCLSLLGLGAYHVHLTLRNRTTLETFRAPVLPWGPDSRAYDVGPAANFRQVFGSSLLRCFLPLPSTPGSGLVFPTRGGRDDGGESGGGGGAQQLLGNGADSSDTDVEANYR